MVGINQETVPVEAVCPNCASILQVRATQPWKTKDYFECERGCGFFDRCAFRECSRLPYQQEPLCVMHSADPQKNSVQFQDEIRRLMTASFQSKGTQRAVLSGFVFFCTFGWMDDIVSVDCARAVFHEQVGISDGKGSYIFRGATFAKRAYFEIRGDVDVSGCEFLDEALFKFCRASASFDGAKFRKKAVFDSSTFRGAVSFRGATFDDDVSLNHTNFGPDATSAKRNAGKEVNQDIVDFTDTIFAKPQVRWFRTNRGLDGYGLRVRFRNCNVEPMTFVDVQWLKHGNRLVIQDELDLSVLDYESGREALYRKTDHELVAIVYRQLATSFERSRAFDSAEECLTGVWEMKRRDRSLSRWERMAIEAYRLASAYGRDYVRPFFCILGLVFVVFPLIYVMPAAGIQPVPDATGVANVTLQSAHDHSVLETAYGHRCLVTKEQTQRAVRAIERGLVFSVESVTFARHPAYAATRVCGRLVAASESVVIGGLVALFLLALRRRFKH